MIKFYFLTLAVLFLMVSASAQQVELIGMGMYNQETGSLPVVDDPDLVDVTLFSVYLSSNGETPTGDVNFWDNTPEDVDAPFTSVAAANNLSPLPSSSLGYYTTVFDDDVDGDGENIIVDPDNIDNTYSFYAYVERNDPNADYYSVFDYTHTHFWRNDGVTPITGYYTYELSLLPNGLVRNVILAMPFSGLQNNPENLDRVAVVRVEADGMTTIEYEFTGDKLNDFFYYQFTSPEFEVPASADKIYVSVYSPETPWSNDDPRPRGDSFMCGGVVADVTDSSDDDPGCTYTQGYWKTHSEYGPAGPADPTWYLLGSLGPDTPFYHSGATWYEVFWTPVRGNKYYSLAHQFMAAHLNFLNDADLTDAQTAYDIAEALFADPENTPLNVKADKKLNKLFGSYVGTLTDYNEGTIGPGHCDEMDSDDDKSSEISNISDELRVYPNPVGNSGTIEFASTTNGQATVEIYNIVGAKVGVLYNDVVKADQKQTVIFNTDKYTRGMYIVVVRNESTVYKQKISIVK